MDSQGIFCMLYAVTRLASRHSMHSCSTIQHPTVIMCPSKARLQHAAWLEKAQGIYLLFPLRGIRTFAPGLYIKGYKIRAY